MKRTAFITYLFVLVAASLFVQQTDFPKLTGPYLGQKPPGLTPEILAPGILSRFSMLHGKLVFSPDGLETFWTCNAAPVQSRWTARQTPQGIWTAPEPSFFSIEYVENSMAYNADGKRLYFHSRRPLQGTGAPKDKDIWYRQKTPKGWGDPVPLGPPVNLSTTDESAPYLAADGTLFFTRQESTGAHGAPGHGTAQIDIYYSEWKNGAYAEPVRMGPEINSEYPEIDPVTAPDKSYLVFTSARPDGYSRMMNLYVSFRTADGRWTPAQSLSHALKIDNIWFPSLSTDGAYLFFCGGYPTDKGYTDSRYYWISTKVIDGLRPKDPTSLSRQQNDFPKLTGPYLGQKPPGIKPEHFGAGIIDNNERVFAITFSPDGKECFYTKSLNTNTIMTTKEINGTWKEPTMAGFSGKVFDFEPHITPDGKKMIFGSRRSLPGMNNQDLIPQWVIEKKDDEWSEPKSLGSPFSDGFCMYVSVANNGNIYFTGKDGIYRSQFLNGKYSSPEKLGHVINNLQYAAHPFIAPDESYLIFDAQLQEGNAELFISFRHEDESWSKTQRFDSDFNTDQNELAAFVSRICSMRINRSASPPWTNP